MGDSGTLFRLAWQILPRLPGPVVRAIFETVARTAHMFHLGGVSQLEQNLHRVTGLSGAPLRRLTKDGIRRYMRYYAEVFQLPSMTPEQISARVRVVNDGPVRAALNEGAVVLGLGHLGNWDLAGAWAPAHLAPVITVAEKLQPPELFEQFLDFREGLGMKIFAFEKGTGLFGQLRDAAQDGAAIMPLLVDRDLSRDGIEVQVCGYPMRVAPGPATISIAAGVPFAGAFIRHERLRGSRRRAAGSPWGIVIEFTDLLHAEPDEQQVAALMQEWADRFSQFLQTHPQDWHMLQKSFAADLDAERLARATGSVYGDHT